MLALAAATFTAQAQSDPDMTNAILALRNNDLAKAKVNIDKAIAKGKVNDKPKVWRYKAEIYEKIMASPDKNLAQLLGDTGEIAALNAIQMAKQTAGGKTSDEHYNVAKAIEPNIRIHVNNKAVGQFQKEDFDGAFRSFMLMTRLNPKDTAAYENAIVAAIRGTNLANAKAAKSAMEANGLPVSASLYKNMGSMAINKGDTAEFYNFMLEGRKKHPKDKDFINQELRYYIDRGKTDELRAKLEENIKAEPGNALYYQLLGQLYSNEAKELANKKKGLQAHAARAKAIEIYGQGLAKGNPDKDARYDLHYNTGVMYLDIAGPAADSLNNMGPKTPAPVRQKTEARVNTHYKNALDSFDQAYAIKNDERALLRVMMKLYGHFRNEAKVAQLEKEMEKAK